MKPKSKPFQGFPSGKVPLTLIPGAFFYEMLPRIDHLGELKLTLYVFWRLDQMKGMTNFLRKPDFVDDRIFMSALAEDIEQAKLELDDCLQRAVQRGTLLPVQIPSGEVDEDIYFLNSDKGRSAVLAIQHGEWQSPSSPDVSTVLRPEPANIFGLYEQNIGPLTPMITEALGEAEDSYPASWIEEAFRIAVERNARNWRYISAILRGWQEEGRNAQEDRRDAEKTGRKYIEGELSDYIQH